MSDTVFEVGRVSILPLHTCVVGIGKLKTLLSRFTLVYGILPLELTDVAVKVITLSSKVPGGYVSPRSVSVCRFLSQLIPGSAYSREAVGVNVVVMVTCLYAVSSRYFSYPLP